jgi:uncharacterized protein
VRGTTPPNKGARRKSDLHGRQATATNARRNVFDDRACCPDRNVISFTRRFPSVRLRSAIALAAMIALLSTSIGAEPLASIPNPRTRNGTWVTDMSGTLREETIARLNSTIGEFERTNGAEMAVVVIRSLDGQSIEEAAVALFDLWDIGKTRSDNGILLLWSTGDRRVRVEVGYGLEGVLPDGKVGAILDAHVLPKFRSGEFDEGLLAGVDAILRAAASESVELPSPRSGSYESGQRGVVAIVIGLVAAIPIGVSSIVGFWIWRRRRRRRCSACQTLMTRLAEADDDVLLEGGQQAEERIGSVDYDVWKCPGCGHHFTLRYPKWVSSYAQCPQCHHRTQASAETVVEAATAVSSGSARVIETCAFCSFQREYTKVLPRIQSSGSSSGGSSSGGSGSFGGGRSGGGGASRGY